MAERDIDQYLRESLRRKGLDMRSAERIKNACMEFEKKQRRGMTEKEFLMLKMNAQGAVNEIRSKR